MKVEFRFNGRCEIHLTPENEEEDFHLTMISRRVDNKGGVAEVTHIVGLGDRYDSMVIGVDR